MDRKQRKDFFTFLAQNSGLRPLERFRVRVAFVLRPELWDEVDTFVTEKLAAEGKALGDLTDFLDWLIENADEIIALIKMIIELFS